jgi:hypothetical protein
MSYHDSTFKIYTLIFIASFFDFVEFVLSSYYFPKFENISKSLNIRLGSALTLSSFILSYFFLRIKIYNHQKFALVIISACFLMIIIIEISFNIIYKILDKYNFIIILLIIISFFFIGYQNNIK